MFPMRSVLLVAALMGITGQAHALSCARPDPVETFHRLAQAEESYFVLYGQLTFDESTLPQGSSFEQLREPDPIAAQFEGKSLSRAGFVNDYASNVTLQIGCADPWCGSARSGVDAVYFVAATDTSVTMQAGPCGGMIFEEPTAATLNMLTTCMQGGACTPEVFE